MELNDVEIGRLMGMSKSAVQRHRTKTLKELRVKLMAIMPEEVEEMKQPSYKGFAPLSDAVIDAACAGDVDAIDRILRHYDGYINKLCVRKYIDGSGNVQYDVDEYMKRRLQIKLIHSIVVTIE